MNKSLFSLWLSCFCSVAAGQGLVNFFNNPTTLILGMNGAPMTGAGNYYFGLFTAPVGTTDPALFRFTRCYATNQAAAGRINGGWAVAVPDWPAGTERAFLVCGWPAYAGHDWNPSWLMGGAPLGVSMIASGIAGGMGTANFPVPPLNLFSSTTINSGFMVLGCLGPYWEGIWRWPTNQTVVIGASAVFDVAAAACPFPLYQWYFNGAPIPGATDGFYRITNAQPADAGTYSVMLSNPDWPSCCRTQSTGATLTVLMQPIIGSQPQSQTAYVGSTVHLEVSASGPAPLSFQWFFNGGPLAAATSPDLWLTNVQVSDSGPYTVAITNLYGAITSSPAVLTVLASPPTLVLSPWDRTAVVGRFVDFVVKAEGGLPLSYQWFLNGKHIAGATTSVLHLTNLGSAQSGSYSVAVTNVFGAITSPPAMLRVIPVPNYPGGEIIGWGSTNPLPVAWNDVIAISAGGDHDLALRKDGTVMAWGQDTFGQSTVPAGLADVIQVAAGGSHSLALKADGSVVAWGWNYRGQTDVPSGLSDVVAIAASGMRSLALTAEGTVVAWGDNMLGESTVPTNLDGVVAIAAGVYHTLALRFDGGVVAWGHNSYGQSSVPENLSAAIAIAAGGDNSLALVSDGTVVGWGGSLGQTGVPPGLNGVIGIAAGADMFNTGDSEGLALRLDGTVVAWGNNSQGQASVPPGLAGVVAVSAGGYHSLALAAPWSVVTPQHGALTNSTRITINDHAAAVPYPSVINVSGLAGRIADLTVTIHGLSHSSVHDVNLLLAGPSGHTALLMAHAGDGGPADNVDLTFDDSAVAPIAGTVLSGRYRPTQIEPTPIFPPPALASPYATTLSTFSNLSPNTVWSLFVLDDSSGNTGLMTGGWSLEIATQGEPPTVTSPSSTTVEIGSLARFRARAAGDPPLLFQWFFNGSILIPGATNSTLELPEVQIAQAGDYTVVVTNAFGVASSTPALLGVIPPVERRLVPGLLLVGQAGTSINLDCASLVDLAPDWTPLAAVPLASGSQFYFDLTMPLPPQRFYRAWQPNLGGVPPTTPHLDMVPALTLAGTVGASVRVDYINQFGPTDAWVALETITLTNTSQLFFDTSAIGQPPRLWRIVPVP